MFGIEFFREVYITNIEKCTDLFGSDEIRSRDTVFAKYFEFVSEVLKVYNPDVFTCNDETTMEERQDVKEMLEAIIDTIHYAKCKRSKRK